MKKDAQGKWYLSVIGPTTSIRMEPHADFVGQQGVKVIIGKGGMGDGTKAALQKYKQVYVQACPGCAVVLAAGIVGTKEPHWFEHGISDRSSSPWTRTATAAMTRYVTTHRRSKKKS